MTDSIPLIIKPEVHDALESGIPVVALESTIVAHGMPWPQNLETARGVEQVIRENGAVPATIAILNGHFLAGLSSDELQQLAENGSRVRKCSRRDIPFVLARKEAGATTVAATMIGTALAGIEVFATGGIGGVHRGATDTMDVSADLQELASTPIAVVSAGAKSILDLGLTLEYLETQGVPVVGIGTDEFPAFFTRKSGFPVDYRIDDLDELAAAWRYQRRLEFPTGMVIANPIPKKAEANYTMVEEATVRALREADAAALRGKHITPFLLSRIKELTGGKSLEANIELVRNNAAVAARLAAAILRKAN